VVTILQSRRRHRPLEGDRPRSSGNSEDVQIILKEAIKLATGGIIMPINGMTILDGSTAQAAPTGGAAATLEQVGVEVKNGVHVADTATAFTTRLNATFRNRVPVLQSDGTYSKAKRSIQLVQPKVLASGLTAFNLVRIELELHPEMTATEIETLRYNGSQLLSDPDVDDFVAFGSLA
jgi:hypothetical protein